MKHFLSPGCVLKRLEFPAVYRIPTDELYELDDSAFEFLEKCASLEGCEGGGYDRGFIEYALREGILITWFAGGTKRALGKSPEPSLRYLELQITTRCNLSCRHCYITPSPGDELSLGAIRGILDEFQDMQGLRLLISGGEPLFHANFREINSLLPEYAFRKVLFTNGIFLSREIVESLNVDEIQVSIDGTESGHDALRGKGTFKKAMAGLHMAARAGYDISVSTMVHSMNLDEFEGMRELFMGMEIKDWTVDVPSPTGNLRDNPSFRLPPAIAGKYLRYGFGVGLHGGGEGFACGRHLAAVMAGGEVAKCTFYRASAVGNASEGLEEGWKKIIPVRLDELECDCAVREKCRGGCRYRAALLGNSLGRDLYRCIAYDVLPELEKALRSW
ncbi:MAG TPA: radical SAM protein [Thermodesulfovibrionales bacterium]|nr:radical SAM protein [Thermodesulfovibrionales bacterium]